MYGLIPITQFFYPLTNLRSFSQNYEVHVVCTCVDKDLSTAYIIFPQIDCIRTICSVYFSALIGAQTNEGRVVIEGALKLRAQFIGVIEHTCM